MVNDEPALITELALIAFTASVAQVLREAGRQELDTRSDPTIVRERLEYLVHQACAPDQPHPLGSLDIKSMRGLHALLDQLLKQPDDPLIPY